MSFRRQTDLLLKTCTNPHIFGEHVEYFTRSGRRVRFCGIFDEAFTEIQDGSEAGINSIRPKLGIRDGDIDFKPEIGDRVVIRDQLFSVEEPRPDGRGGTTLYLFKGELA